MGLVSLVGRLLLAAMFAVAGIAKAIDRAGGRDAVRTFGVPAALAGPIGLALPAIELALAAALLVDPVAALAAAAAALLLALFTVAVAIALARGRQPDCRCFGQLRPHRAGRGTVARDAALTAAAAAVAALGWNRPVLSPVAWLGDLQPATAIALMACLVLAMVVALRAGSTATCCASTAGCCSGSTRSRAAPGPG